MLGLTNNKETSSGGYDIYDERCSWDQVKVKPLAQRQEINMGLNFKSQLS